MMLLNDVKISAASARLMFTECGPVCISGGCTGKCCDAPSRPGGCMVTVHHTERDQLAALGAEFDGPFLRPSPTGGCPFKRDGLCSLHVAGAKPFGCVASPFTLNRSGTLVIRNRYKLLPCYRGNGPKAPAYVTFFSSLVAIFGTEAARSVRDHLARGGGDVWAVPLPGVAKILIDNDEVKHAA